MFKARQGHRTPAALVGQVAFAALLVLRRLRRRRRRRTTGHLLQQFPQRVLADLDLTDRDLRQATIWGRSRL